MLIYALVAVLLVRRPDVNAGTRELLVKYEVHAGSTHTTGAERQE